MSVIDEVIRKEKGSPTDAWRRINRDRRATKVKCVHKTAVHRYANGATHKRGAVETRGRKRALSKGDVRKLDLARRRLIKKEDNQHRVTYEDIMEEASLTSEPCQRVCEDALRTSGCHISIRGAKFKYRTKMRSSVWKPLKLGSSALRTTGRRTYTLMSTLRLSPLLSRHPRGQGTVKR